jgi:D-glycero-beta-D-manno-heptose 1-phosphate adenylyltransferase
MRNVSLPLQKIYTLPKLLQQVAAWRVLGKTIAFTNGCFDLLHEGHIFSLSEAAKEADLLIVGVNADASVKKLKGVERPIYHQHSRALLLAALIMVDAVIIFEEDTPHHLIASLLPDVLVKGGDYTIDQVVGAKEVTANGGRVIINPIVNGFSSTTIIKKIKNI